MAPTEQRYSFHFVLYNHFYPKLIFFVIIYIFTEQLNLAARHRNVYYDTVGGDPYGKKGKERDEEFLLLTHISICNQMVTSEIRE